MRRISRFAIVVFAPTCAVAGADECDGAFFRSPAWVATVDGFTFQVIPDRFELGYGASRGLVEFWIGNVPNDTPVRLIIRPDVLPGMQSCNPGDVGTCIPGDFTIHGRPGNGQVDWGDCYSGPTYEQISLGSMVSTDIPLVVDVTSMIHEAVARGDTFISMCFLSGLNYPGDGGPILVRGPVDGEDPLDNFSLAFIRKAIPGDVDHDGDVDLIDFGVLQANFTGSGN